MAKALNVNLSVTANTSQARAELQGLQTQLNSLVSDAGKINLTAGLNTGELQKAVTMTGELAQHLKNATNVDTGLLNFTSLQKSLTSSKKSLTDYGQALLSLGPQGQQAFSSLATAVAKSDVAIGRTSTLLGQLGITLKNTARWQISSSLLHSFMGSISSAINYAKDLNASLTNIQIVTQASDEKMARFAETANKAAKALSITTTQYTDAALIYYQQGLSDKQVQERVNVTAKMANITGQSAQQVSDQMTAIWNNFAKGGENLEYYADVITALGAATASSSEEISRGLEKFAAIADTVGLSYENATAALATITATTRQSADTVGTGLRTLFSRLQSLSLGETLEDGVNLTKYTKALQTVGVEALDASGNLRTMDDIIADLGNKWDDLSKAQQTALAQTVGGVRQYTTLIALMDNFDFYKQNQKVAASAEGTVQKQQEIYEKSWKAANKRLKAAGESLTTDILNDKVIINLTNGLTGILTLFDQIIDKAGGLKTILFTIGTIVLKNQANMSKLTGKFVNGIYNVMSYTRGGQNALIVDRQTQLQNLANTMKAESNGDPVMSIRADNLAKELQIQDQIIAKAGELTSQEQEIAQIRLDGIRQAGEAYANMVAKNLTAEKNLNTQRNKYYEQLLKAQFEGKFSSSGLLASDLANNKFYQRIVGTGSGSMGLAGLRGALSVASNELGGLGDTNLTASQIQAYQAYFTDTFSNVKGVPQKYIQSKLDILNKELNNPNLTADGLVTAIEKIITQITSAIAQAQARLEGTYGGVPTGNLVNASEEKGVQNGKTLYAKLIRDRMYSDGALPAEGKDGTMTNTQQKIQNIATGFSAATSAALQMGMAISSINNLFTVFGDTSSSATDKLNAGLMGAVMILPLLGNAITMVGKMITGTLATAEKASAILTIIAAVATVVYAGIQFYNNYINTEETNAERIERLKQEAENAKSAAKDARAAYDNLVSQKSTHNELLEELAQLTKGTIEFRDKLLEANQLATEIITKNHLTPEDWEIDPRTGAIVPKAEAVQRTQEDRLYEAEQLSQTSLYADYVLGLAKSPFEHLELFGDVPKKINEGMAEGLLNAFAGWGMDNPGKTYNDFISAIYDFAETFDPDDSSTWEMVFRNGYSVRLNGSVGENFMGVYGPDGKSVSGLHEQIGNRSSYEAGDIDVFNQLLAWAKANNMDLDSALSLSSASMPKTSVDALGNLMKMWAMEDDDQEDIVEQAVRQHLTQTSLFSNDAEQRTWQDKVLSENRDYQDYLKASSEDQEGLIRALYEQLFHVEAAADIEPKIIEESVRNQILLNKTHEYYSKALQGFNVALNGQFKNFRKMSYAQIQEKASLLSDTDEVESLVKEIILQQANQTRLAYYRATAAAMDHDQLQENSGILGDFMSEVDMDTLSSATDIINKYTNQFGKKTGAAISLAMARQWQDFDTSLLQLLEETPMGETGLETLANIRKAGKHKGIDVSGLFSSAIEDIGSSGLFQELYESASFSDILEDLQEELDNTGKIGADSILAAAESCEALNELLLEGHVNAAGLGSALTAINTDNLSVDQLSDGLLEALSLANSVKNNLAIVTKLMSDFVAETDIRDIGQFFSGGSKVITESIEAGAFFNPQALQYMEKIFGPQTRAEFEYQVQQWLETPGMTYEQIQKNIQDNFGDMWKVMEAVQEYGDLGPLIEWQKNNNNNLKELGIVTSDSYGNFNFDLDFIAENFKTQEEFVKALIEQGHLDELTARAIAADLDGRGALHGIWQRGDLQQGFDKLISSGDILTSAQIKTFFNDQESALGQIRDVESARQIFGIPDDIPININFEDGINSLEELLTLLGLANKRVLDLGDNFTWAGKSATEVENAFNKSGFRRQKTDENGNPTGEEEDYTWEAYFNENNVSAQAYQRQVTTGEWYNPETRQYETRYATEDYELSTADLESSIQKWEALGATREEAIAKISEQYDNGEFGALSTYVRDAAGDLVPLNTEMEEFQSYWAELKASNPEQDFPLAKAFEMYTQKVQDAEDVNAQIIQQASVLSQAITMAFGEDGIPIKVTLDGEEFETVIDPLTKKIVGLKGAIGEIKFDPDLLSHASELSNVFSGVSQILSLMDENDKFGGAPLLISVDKATDWDKNAQSINDQISDWEQGGTYTLNFKVGRETGEFDENNNPKFEYASFGIGEDGKLSIGFTTTWDDTADVSGEVSKLENNGQARQITFTIDDGGKIASMQGLLDATSPTEGAGTPRYITISFTPAGEWETMQTFEADRDGGQKTVTYIAGGIAALPEGDPNLPKPPTLEGIIAFRAVIRDANGNEHELIFDTGLDPDEVGLGVEGEPEVTVETATYRTHTYTSEELQRIQENWQEGEENAAKSAEQARYQRMLDANSRVTELEDTYGASTLRDLNNFGYTPNETWTDPRRPGISPLGSRSFFRDGKLIPGVIDITKAVESWSDASEVDQSRLQALSSRYGNLFRSGPAMIEAFRNSEYFKQVKTYGNGELDELSLANMFEAWINGLEAAGQHLDEYNEAVAEAAQATAEYNNPSNQEEETFPSVSSTISDNALVGDNEAIIHGRVEFESEQVQSAVDVTTGQDGIIVHGTMEVEGENGETGIVEYDATLNPDTGELTSLEVKVPDQQATIKPVTTAVEQLQVHIRDQYTKVIPTVDEATANAVVATIQVAVTGALSEGLATGLNNILLPNYAGGRHLNSDFQGIAETGELGPELWVHNGEPNIVGQHGREKIFISQGDQIFTANQTRKILADNPSLQSTPGFADNLNGAAISHLRPSNSSLGTGANSNNKKTKDFEPERYHVITRQLQELERLYNLLSKAKENAYGTNKLEGIQREIAATYDLIEGQRQLIKEAEDYLALDRKRMVEELGVNAIFDEFGNISNWEELQDTIGRAAAENSEDEKLQNQWKAIQQYEETVDKLHEAQTQLQDYIYQLSELQLEKITTEVEISVKLDDQSIDLIDYFIKKIEDKTYKTAEDINQIFDLTRQKLERINNQITETREGIEDIFANLTDKKGNKIEGLTLDKFLTMSPEERDALDLNGNYGEQLEEYASNIQKYLEALNEEKLTGVKNFADAFKNLNEQISNQLDLFSHYNDILDKLQNIIELQGESIPKEMTNAIKHINEAQLSNLKNNIIGQLQDYNRLVDSAAQLRNKIANTTDEALKQEWEKELDELEQTLRDKQGDIADLWSSGLELAKDIFERTLDELVADYENSLSEMYSTSDALQSAYERKKKIDEFYVEDYEKFYQLSKLQRSINKDIDDLTKNNMKSTRGLRNLLSEIQQLRAKGQELSDYDLQILEKRYEYEKALADLQDAQNAKSTVRLQRDQNGNWGYVYTNNEDNLNELEQAVEDKLYEWQKTAAERIHTIQDDIMSQMTTVASDLAEMHKNGTPEDEIRDYLQDTLHNLTLYRDGLDKALSDAGMTEGLAREKYGAAGFDILSQFNETLLQAVTGSDNSLDTFYNNLINSINNTGNLMGDATGRYQSELDAFNNFFKEHGEDLGTVISRWAGEIEGKSNELIGNFPELIGDAKESFDEILNAANEFEKGFLDMYGQIIADNEQMLRDLTEALRLLNQLKFENKKEEEEIENIINTSVNNNNNIPTQETSKSTPKKNNSTYTSNNYTTPQRVIPKKSSLAGLNKLMPFDTGGYTGDWETTNGRLAILHQKEQVFNADDTAKLLDAAMILRSLDLSSMGISRGLGDLISPFITGTDQTIEQEVHIVAEFPNATNHIEIEEAFNNLNNKAVQYANRKNKGID